MKRTTLFTSIAATALLTVSLPVHAETAQQKASKEQLASQIGVDPSEYTLQELATLNCRLEGAANENERKRILSDFDGKDLLPNAETTESKMQLAASLEVDPSEYTVKELALLKHIIESEDCNVSNPQQWAKVGERVTNETAGAKRQLAMTLGVKPEDYTLAELVKMHLKDQEN